MFRVLIWLSPGGVTFTTIGVYTHIYIARRRYHHHYYHLPPWIRSFDLSLQRLSETFLTVRRIIRDVIIHAHTSMCSCKVLVILVRF
jgi:hypothetical protein